MEHNRKRIKEMSLSIMSKPIVLPDRTVVNWFSAIKPLEKEAGLEVRFDKALKPYLIQLKERYTTAELEHLLTFKSKYSGRLYLLLKSEYGLQENHKVIVPATFEVDDIINRFSMPDTYKRRYSHFKESFLHKSLEEINTLTEFFVTYDVIKAGRKVWKIQFLITKPSKTTNEQIDKILNTKTKDDFIPFEASDRLKEIVLSDEVDLDTNYVKHIFEHYLLRDIENVCDTVWQSWDNAKLMSKKALFLGEIKKLNKKKTENHTFGFDEI
ncbi:replication initiation protein [Francisella noatunensis]|nr:replication initiation protein [Francisella noatunensis]